METERLMRVRGLPAHEARPEAHIAFGGVENFKEQGREARGLMWIGAIALDCRLGVRLLSNIAG